MVVPWYNHMRDVVIRVVVSFQCIYKYGYSIDNEGNIQFVWDSDMNYQWFKNSIMD